MNISQLPLWQTPEQVCDILLALPEKQRNRALYELVFLFDHDNPQGRTEAESQLATLRLLWHDPRFQGLENIKHWLRDVLALDEVNGSCVEINSVVYTFGFCLKTRLSSYPALSRMSIDTGNPLCS